MRTYKCDCNCSWSSRRYEFHIKMSGDLKFQALRCCTRNRHLQFVLHVVYQCFLRISCCCIHYNRWGDEINPAECNSYVSAGRRDNNHHERGRPHYCQQTIAAQAVLQRKSLFSEDDESSSDTPQENWQMKRGGRGVCWV